LVLAAAGVSVMQVGLMFVPDRLMPDFSRIDPLAGFGRILSWQGVARLFFGMIKILIIGVVAYNSLVGERDTILALGHRALGEIAVYLLDVLGRTTLRIAIALVIVAVLDYAFQWWRQEQDLRMSQQEMKEEMKQLNGDPQVQARRRQVQRQRVLHRLQTAVPKADVVVTNPTELAVALQYDPETMAAPIVVAKGAGVLAQRIRRLALEHGVTIVERKPLAQALYKDVDLNRPIPTDLFAAVSEVLAYVYTLKGKKFEPRK
jgi:flagellar biosynthetic protein FlhB